MEIASTSALPRMLGKVFDAVDSDKSGTLDRDEFKSLYEVLKAGIAVDKDKKPVIDAEQYFGKIDTNGSNGVTKEELLGASVLMPANLTDESLKPLISYLLNQQSVAANMTATLLQNDPEQKIENGAAPTQVS
jgi:hypothetical protein